MFEILLVTALAFMGKDDVFRCTNPQGAVIYQDTACANAAVGNNNQQHLSLQPNNSHEALRQWLKDFPKQANARPAVKYPLANAIIDQPHSLSPDAYSSNPQPLDVQRLSQCSALFLSCASQGSVKMDTCISNMPRCETNSSTPCCPELCISRYAQQRDVAQAQSASVRNALLDNQNGSCAAKP